jgi:uncharacterized protein YkwD
MVIILGITYFYQWNQPKKEDRFVLPKIENQSEQPELKNEHVIKTDGLFSYIGKSSGEIEKILGKPARIDRSSYDYDWWIYNQDPKSYIQVGIYKNKVVTVYGIGENINISPFKIGQPLQEIYQILPLDQSVSLEVNDNSYRFELSEEDLNTRPLLPINGVFAQLYIDRFTGKLSSIRIMDDETLVKLRPYELVYRGELITAKELSQEEKEKVQKDTEKQIFDITNVIRLRHHLKPVQWDETTAEVAFKHSKDMYEENYFSHQSPTNGSLADRLADGGVFFQIAGENIAAKYVDGIAAVEGWLNSKSHRETLLNEDFTHLGVGVYDLYYTQNFIKPWE